MRFLFLFLVYNICCKQSREEDAIPELASISHRDIIHVLPRRMHFGHFLRVVSR